MRTSCVARVVPPREAAHRNAALQGVTADARGKYPRKTQYFTNAKINDKPFDLLFVEDEESITTLLIPITEQYRKDAVNLEQCGLTRSEMTIALFVCQGKTNSEISNQLHISASTLKSHLNHIYSKVDREFLQSRRKKT